MRGNLQGIAPPPYLIEKMALSLNSRKSLPGIPAAGAEDNIVQSHIATVFSTLTKHCLQEKSIVNYKNTFLVSSQFLRVAEGFLRKY